MEMKSWINIDPDAIATLCFDSFDKLPKTGKPANSTEWTVLSCILKYEEFNQNFEVVALGTGTKCIGEDSLSSTGDILNDSHAEVMARRGFLRYIYDQLERLDAGDKGVKNIFRFDTNLKKFIIDKDVSFHFFSTHPPCGDASIYDIEPDEPCLKKPKLSVSESHLDNGSLLNTHLTGGKLIESNADDLMAQDVCKIRTKPGKGVRTLSLSCSDKLSRWNILGIQGALISSLIENPIFMESFILCGNFDTSAMKRAVWSRWEDECLNCSIQLHQPEIRRTSGNVVFQFEKDANAQPSPSSIVWCKVRQRCLEVAVNGKKQGMTKKKMLCPSARLKISKIELFKLYMKILNQYYSDENKITYKMAKQRSYIYTDTWKHVKTKVFKKWIQKPSNLYDFYPDD